MPYYKDISDNNQLYWLDRVEDEDHLPTTCVRITDEEGKAIEEANKLPPPSVTQISPRQIRMALTQMGLRNAVEAVVAAGDQNLKDWYEFSTYFDRNHPQVLAMATALNVTDAQVDALFDLAATL